MFKFEDKDMLPSASIEDVYKYCNHYDLFRYYIGDFKIGKPILSPLRHEDAPSFAIFVKGEKILFNDFVLGGGDIIRYVQIKYGLTIQEAIGKIVHDSGLSDKFRSDNEYIPKPLISYNKKIEYNKPQINVKRRKWLERDIKFWEQFYIDEETLKKYRVSPIQYIFFGTKIVKAETYAYCFEELKDGISSFTIYQPFSKLNKWFKSHDASVFYGWSQLPESGDTLIITKSLKDVACIDSITKIPTTALQSEKVKPKKHIVEELKSRFKDIYLIYDNDYNNVNKDKPNYGREFGKEICDEFGFIQREIPDKHAIKYDAKDISDLAKNSNKELVDNLLNHLIRK